MDGKQENLLKEKRNDVQHRGGTYGTIKALQGFHS
jgi:hypothetical protein